MRVPLIGFSPQCPLTGSTKGNQYIKYPIKKIRKVRLNILASTWPALICANLPEVKLMALPTANKNEGKTRSVGVNPNQEACSSGAKGAAPLPGVFTMIIKQM